MLQQALASNMSHLDLQKMKVESTVSSLDTDEALYLAIDGGGTKTEAVAFLANGKVLAHVLLAASLNPNGAEVGMAQVFEEVLEQVGAQISLDAISEVFVGLAGASSPQYQEQVAGIFEQLFTRVKPVRVVHDAVAALWSGVDRLPGLVLVAGTGTVAYGVTAEDQEFRVGGWGYLIGDEGGGYDLGRRALQAVMAAYDTVSEPTALRNLILEHWQLTTETDLISLVYGNGKRAIAALAPLVFVAASADDAVALQIVRSVARSTAELLRDSCRIAREVHGVRSPLSVVKVGGLWSSQEFKAAFDAHLLDMHLTQDVNLITPELPPVFGGARFLMRARAQGIGAAFTANFTRSFMDLSQRNQAVATDHGKGAHLSAVTPLKLDETLDLATLGTECVDPAMHDLDTLDSLAIVKRISATNQEAVLAVAAEAESIAAAIKEIYARMAAGGRLFYVGAGTSGRLGVLDASECPPTFGVSFEKVQGVIAGGESALMYPAEGAEDDAAQGGEDLLARGLTQEDVVVAVAASGRTPYCVGALQAASMLGASTISVSCNKGAWLSQFAMFPIEVATGAEIIAGSTRMKAGTAQKIILNMLTTTSMIRMGKVFGGQMVDMVASNQKLKKRARRIVVLAGELGSEAQADVLLDQAEGNIKAAIVMAHTGRDFASAQRLLEVHDGYVRKAIAAVGGYD